MADAAFTTAKYPAHTTKELEAAIAAGRDVSGFMAAEIARRCAVQSGDVSAMTPGERLRFAKAGR